MARSAWTPKGMVWRVAPPRAEADEIARALRTAPLVAQTMLNRGLADVDAARAFLNPKLNDLADPSLLYGADAAARRIAQAIRLRQRVVIYGDYDVDGITAVAILHSCLTMLGGEVDFYVPHRLEEGYGVNSEAVAKIIADGTKLIVTVDCGISADGPIAQAAAAGVEVIVTDHHSLGSALPRAASAIVHPAMGEYPNRELSGAGVAFKLAWQLAREVCGSTRVDEPMRDFLLNATCLAALGTIADVVPLVGENRVLATFGLRGLPQSRLAGLRALIAASGLTGERLDAYHVGFLLAPRLNACGRMGHAALAVELLTSADDGRCHQIAEYLSQQNLLRQKVEREIADQAVEMALQAGYDRDDCPVIVLADRQWHGGVVGIVAARLVERFNRPAMLIAINGDGCGQGSARSVEGFHMRDALAACGEHLLSFGGHAMAGGLRIEPGRIDDFRKAMLGYAAGNFSGLSARPVLDIDAETTAGMLSLSVGEHFERMAPFGQGNPPPVVALRNCELLSPPRAMGRSGQTVGLMLRQNGSTIRAVGFGMGELVDRMAGVKRADIAGEVALNRFNGRTSVELKLRDVQWE